MRLTAPELASAYCQGMCAEGATVLDAGEVGTEMLYYLVGSRDLDGGLMCTASHNPKRYTGAKLVRRGAIALSGDAGIGELRGQGSKPASTSAPGGGSVEHVPLYEEFQEAALAFIDPGAVKPMRVVVDGGNGMAGPMVGPLLRRLGLDLIETYWEPDGRFPDHEPNPLLPENREFIMSEVVRQQADLGIAWDGDADRCFFIDDRGSFVDGDFLTALLARVDPRQAAPAPHPDDPLRRPREPGGRGRHRERRRARADEPRRTRVLQDPDARGAREFGGEVSGHYYFRDFYCADSGTIPALLILELLSERGARMSELLEPFRSRYFISGEINSEVTDQDAKMDELATRYQDGRQYRLDGISVEYDDWHFNVRSSNTEPLLRLCLESLRSHAGHGASARRGAGSDPFVTTPDRRATSAEDALALAERPGSTGSRCRPRSWSEGSTAT